MTVYHKGKLLSLSEKSVDEVGAQAIQLLQSCRDRSKRLIGDLDWQAAMAHGGGILITFSKVQLLEIKARGSTPVTQILIPIEEQRMGSEIFARRDADYYSPFLAYDKTLANQLVQKLNALRSGHY